MTFVSSPNVRQRCHLVTVLSLLLYVVPVWAIEKIEEDEATLVRAVSAEDAKRAADASRKLGLLQSVPGLKEMVRRKNPKLVDEYSREFRFQCGADLGIATERLLIENFEDVTLRTSLEVLLMRCPPYRSRRLFDVLAAGVKRGGDRWEVHRMAQLLVHTDLTIEPQALDLLRQLPLPTPPIQQPSHCAEGYGTPREELIKFFGKRRYGPAVTELQRVLSDGGTELGIACQALTRIGTRAALRTSVECVTRFKREFPEEAGCGLGGIVDALGELPPDAPLDFTAFRRALAPQTTDSFIREYVALIKHRHEPAGVKDLLRYLDTGPDGPGSLYQLALEVLLDFESPEVWRQALEHIEQQHAQGRLDEGHYAFASAGFRERLQSPERFVAERRERERQSNVERANGEELRRRSAALAPIRYLRHSDPEAYVRRYRQLLLDWEAEDSAHPDRQGLDKRASGMGIGSPYCELGTFARFALRHPQEALGFYEKGLAVSAPQQQLPIHIMLADLYEFELGDSARAIAEYDSVLVALEREAQEVPPGQGAAVQPRLTWIDREIDYLKTGNPFSGPIGRDDVGQVFMAVMLLATPQLEDMGLFDQLRGQFVRQESTSPRPMVDGAKVAELLDTLPTSRLILVGTVQFLPYLSPDAILRYLSRQDPARFLSASLLGAAVMMESQLPVAGTGAGHSDSILFPPEALRDEAGNKGSLVSAAASFTRTTGIRFDVLPDPRFSTPDKTWESFLAALKVGDAKAVLTCFASSKAAQLRPLFTHMSAQEMKEMAASFVTFVLTADMGTTKEYGLGRLVNGERRAGFAYFENDAGEWKIGEM